MLIKGHSLQIFLLEGDPSALRGENSSRPLPLDACEDYPMPGVFVFEDSSIRVFHNSQETKITREAIAFLLLG